MKPDLSKMSVEDLQKLAEEASNMIGTRRQQDLKDGYAQAEKIASDLGVTLDELIEAGRSKSTRKTGSRKPVEPRYRNPADTAQTWTGRGKQPRWLAAAIAAGAKIEDFLINK
ncbi:MAG: H-NS histone family protein [Pseudomonadota bacterium]|nr:H-NS histone family protein [Pseudomonadota bacterium]